MATFLASVLTVGIIASLIQGWMWLLVKAVQIVSKGLFNQNIDSKFWYIYLAILLINLLVGGASLRKGIE